MTNNMTDKALELGLFTAQSKARKLLQEIEERKLIRTGISESLLSQEIYELAFELFNTKKHWHKRIVRTGQNSVLAFSADPPDRVLETEDLVYLDLGPVFDEFEGDIGK